MEIYNPMLDKEEKSFSKTKMEILTEYILEELNSYIEHEKKAYNYIPIFDKLLPGINEEVIDTTIRLSKNLVKSLITNDVDLFVDSLSSFGTDVNFLSKEGQKKFCNDLRLELYKNAEKALENK